MTKLNIGDTLPNGALLLAEHNNVVLAKARGVEPYVTWEHNGDYGTYWGHYFRNEADAMRDYLNRSNVGA